MSVNWQFYVYELDIFFQTQSTSKNTNDEEDLWENDDEKDTFKEKVEMAEAMTREIYDSENKIFDFRKRRATDINATIKQYYPKH